MSDKLVLIASGTLATGDNLLFTNVTGDEVAVMQIDLNNGSGSPVTGINMSNGADSAATRIFHNGTVLAANADRQKFYSPGHPLTGTNTIRGGAGTGAVVTYAIWGTRRYV